MNFEQHFDIIKTFLKDNRPLWSMEILNTYPGTLEHYSEQWLEELRSLSIEDLYKIDGKEDITTLNSDSSLGSFFQTMKDLSDLPKSKLDDDIKLPDWAFNKVKSKKRHEIARITQTIDKLNKEKNYSHVVDIGGGQGHLSRIITQYYGLDSYCIDQSKEFQEIGMRRLKKYPAPKGAKKLTFLNVTFGTDQEISNGIFNKDCISLGLHTCGALAVNHIDHSIKNSVKSLINFGCCYLRIKNKDEINISNKAKVDPLELTEHALNLATRSHSEISWNDYLLKIRVKKYRYALHLLMYHKLDIKKFMAVGEINTKLYNGPFINYAKTKLNFLEIKHQLSDEEISNFFDEPWVSKLIWDMFLANIIRWKIGRVVELFILLDRAIYLEENNYKVDLIQMFEEKISPRNIGIIAHKS